MGGDGERRAAAARRIGASRTRRSELGATGGDWRRLEAKVEEAWTGEAEEAKPAEVADGAGGAGEARDVVRANGIGAARGA